MFCSPGTPGLHIHVNLHAIVVLLDKSEKGAEADNLSFVSFSFGPQLRNLSFLEFVLVVPVFDFFH